MKTATNIDSTDKFTVANHKDSLGIKTAHNLDYICKFTLENLKDPVDIKNCTESRFYLQINCGKPQGSIRYEKLH